MYIFFIPNFHITSKLIEKKNLTLFENAPLSKTRITRLYLDHWNVRSSFSQILPKAELLISPSEVLTLGELLPSGVVNEKS